MKKYVTGKNLKSTFPVCREMNNNTLLGKKVTLVTLH